MHILFQILALTVFAGIAMVAPQNTRNLDARLVSPEWKYTEPLVDTRNAHLQTAVKSVHTDIPAEEATEETVAANRSTPRFQTASLLNALKRLFGTPKDGQVLMGKNGTYSWQTLPTVTQPGSTVTPRPSAPARAGGGSARGGGGGAAQPAPLPQHSHEDGERGGQISIGSATTGVLAATRGGTGFETYSAGDLLVGSGAGLAKLNKGNQGEVLSVSGSSLVWKDADAAALTGNNARYVNVDGDTMSGALTILTPGSLGLEVVGTISGSSLVLSGMTAGSVPFIGAGGAVTQDVNNFTYDSTYKVLRISSGAGYLEAISELNLRAQAGPVSIYSYGMPLAHFSVGNDQVTIPVYDADNTGLIVKGAASQTANLQEWQNSDEDVLARISSDGKMHWSSTTSLGLTSGYADLTLGNALIRGHSGALEFYNVVGYGNTFYSSRSDATPIKIKGAASQSANLLEVQDSDGNRLASIGHDGRVFSNSSVSLGSWLEFSSGNSTRLFPISGNGTLLLTNNDATDFSRLQFGGTTSSFPALKRNGTGLRVTLADDSGLTNLTAATLSGSALVINGTSGLMGSVGIGTTSPEAKLDIPLPDGFSGKVFGVRTSAGWQSYLDETGNWTMGSVKINGGYSPSSFYPSQGLVTGWNNSGSQGEAIIGFSTGAGGNPRLDIRGFAGGGSQSDTTFMTFLTTGNVGIGTTNPSSMLDIRKDITSVPGVPVGQLVLGGTTDSNERLIMGFDTTNNLGFIHPISSNFHEQLTLNPVDNISSVVAIGTATSRVTLQAALVVNRSSGKTALADGADSTILINNPNATANNRSSIVFGGAPLASLTTDGTTSLSSAVIEAIHVDHTTREGHLMFATKGSDSVLAERMRILSNGNVGIGTSSPTSARLVVKGTTVDSSAAALNLLNAVDTSLFYVGNDGYTGVGTSAPGSKFSVHGAGSVGGTNGFGVAGTVTAGLYSTDAEALNMGPSLGFGSANKADGLTDPYLYAVIQGRKESPTLTDDYAGALSFYTVAGNSTSAEWVRISSSGLTQIGVPTTVDNSMGQLHVQSAFTTRAGITVRAITSQTGNLQEWQNSAGTVLASVTKDGYLKLAETEGSSPYVTFGAANRYGVGTFTGGYTSIFYHNQGSGIQFGTYNGSAFNQDYAFSPGIMKISGVGDAVSSESAFIKVLDDGDYNTSMSFWVNPNGNSNSAVEAMRIKASGNVGIGTSSPDTKLDVVGTMSGSALVVNGTSTLNGAIISATGLRINETSGTDGNPLLVINGGFGTSERFRITNNGGSGIEFSAEGTQPIAFANPIMPKEGIRFQFSDGTGFLIGSEGAPFRPENANIIPLVSKGVTSQTANLQEWQNSDGTALASISSAGAATFGATTITYPGVYAGGATLAWDSVNLNVNKGIAAAGGVFGNGAYATSTTNITIDGSVSLLGTGGGNTAAIINTSGVATANLASFRNNSVEKAFIDSTGQVNGTTGGIVTTVVSGACSDSSFTTDTNGTICVDSSNGRLYFRYGDAWHYTAQTAGFQIPNLERNGRNETEGLNVGDAVIGRIDERMEDGALHGIWEKFDLQTQISATLAAHPELLGTIGTDTSSSPETLTTSDIQDLAVQGSLVVYGNARFAGDVNVQGTLTLGGKQAGMATIRAGQTRIQVNFTDDFGNTPLVTATPQGVPMAFWGVTDVTAGSFTIQLSSPAAADIRFAWMALPHDEALPGEAVVEEVSSTSSAPSESSVSSVSSEAESSESSASSEESVAVESSDASSESSVISVESSSSQAAVSETPAEETTEVTEGPQA